MVFFISESLLAYCDVLQLKSVVNNNTVNIHVIVTCSWVYPPCIYLAAFKGRMVGNFGYAKIVCNTTPNWEENNCSWLG